jgi:hypothetical protein
MHHMTNRLLKGIAGGLGGLLLLAAAPGALAHDADVRLRLPFLDIRLPPPPHVVIGALLCGDACAYRGDHDHHDRDYREYRGRDYRDYRGDDGWDRGRPDGYGRPEYRHGRYQDRYSQPSERRSRGRGETGRYSSWREREREGFRPDPRAWREDGRDARSDDARDDDRSY